MHILGTGLSKTGTTSLHRALQMLGLCCLHYDDKRLNDVLDGSNPRPDFRRYDDVDAVLDIPAACFYPELLAAYPGMKCIHTMRDEDAWWKSIELHFNHRQPVISREANAFKWDLRHYAYGSAEAREFLYRRRYRQHNQTVIATVPPEQLLIMDITQGHGWEKLCPFLGLAIPASPFPRQNERAQASADNRAKTVAELESIIGARQEFVLVDDGWLGGALITLRAVPLLQMDGQDWGAPENDAAALAGLECQLRRGVSHIAFAWPAFWWFDCYKGLMKELGACARCLLRNDRLVVFQLERLEPRPPIGVQMR